MKKLKKFIALVLAPVMAAAFMQGCAPGEAELAEAIDRSEKTDRTELTELSFDFDIERFALADTPSAAEINEKMRRLKELGDDFSAKIFTVKGDGGQRSDVTLAMPDAEADLTFWRNKDDTLIMSVPSTASILLFDALKNKKYLYIGSDELASLLYGGREVAPSLGDGFKDMLKDAFLGRLSYPLVSDTEQRGDTAVYTVKLDAKALGGLAEDALAVMAEPDVTAILASFVFAADTAGSATLDELKADLADELAEAGEGVDGVFELLAASGLLNEGLTLRFHVKNGLVVRREAELRLGYDFQKLGAELDAAFALTVKAATDYTFAEADIEMPALTEENSVDLAAEYAEFKAYDDYRTDSLYWGNYHPADEYRLEREPYTPITVKNIENGREVTVVPGFVDTAADSEYIHGVAMPLDELCSVIDGVSLDWDPVLMGVELRFPDVWNGEERRALIPNRDGVGMALDYRRNFNYEYDEEGIYIGKIYTGDLLSAEQTELIESYDYIFCSPFYIGSDETYSVYCAYYDENGKVYADFDEIFNILGYECKLEGDVLSVRSMDRHWTYDDYKDIGNNLFYNIF